MFLQAQYRLILIFTASLLLACSQSLYASEKQNTSFQTIQDTSIKIKPVINKPDSSVFLNQDTLKTIKIQDSLLNAHKDTILPLVGQDSIAQQGLPPFDQDTTSQSKINPDKKSVIQKDTILKIPKSIGDTLELKIDSLKVYYFTSNIDNYGMGKLKLIDTSLTGIQNYDPFFSKGNYYASLGNTGLPVKNLQFAPKINEGFNYSYNPLEIYTSRNEDVRYYRLVKPFTELFYVMGPQKENTLRVIHSQNISRGLNVGINFKFIHAPGIYQRQGSDNKNLYLTTRYTTKNGRYGFVANYIHDKLIVEESGGLLTDSAFIFSLEVNRALIEVNLNGAQNTFKKGSFYLNEYFNIGKAPYVTIDTLGQKTEHQASKLGQLSHTILAERKSFLFEDIIDDNNFYKDFDQILSDSTLTFDSTRILRIENQIKWTNLGYNAKADDKKLYLYFGAKHQYIEVFDTIGKQSFNQIIPRAGFSASFFKTTKLSADAFYVLGDHNDGDYSLRANVEHSIKLNNKQYGSLFLSAEIAKQGPAYFYNLYHGNYLRWENDFQSEEYLKLNAKYTLWGITAGLMYHKIDHFIFMDQMAHPQQTEITQSVLSASLDITKKFKDFNFDAHLIYQKAKSDSLIRVPEFIGHLSFNYTKGLFKNATTIQPGIEVFYNTSYFADAYMPATRSFYLQNLNKIGNALYADFYFNFTIKNTMFFFKYQHFNAALTGYNYFLVPHYPMHDYAIKFGIIWRFMD